MYDIDAVRRIFPHTRRKSYFNVASTGPLSEIAYRLQDKHVRQVLTTDIGDQSDLFAALDNIRRNAARIFGCRKSEAGYGFNTTFGINLAAFGLPLKKGDEVLLSDVEFPANVYPWLELRNRGVTVKFVKSIGGFFDIAELEKAISDKTRLVALSYVQYFNGFKIDIEAVSEICRRRNIWLVIDAMQAAGCEPLRVNKWKVAVASAGAQKWLLSPQGTGIFYVSRDVQKILRPPWRSWLSVDWKCRWHDLRRFDMPYQKSARQYELGTYPTPLVMALDWSLDYILKLGIGNIQRHNHGLIDMLIEYLQHSAHFRVTGAIDKKHRSSIISFTSDKLDIAEAYRYLSSQGIVAGLREGSIRISIHLYNNRRDMQRLISGLKRFVRTASGS